MSRGHPMRPNDVAPFAVLAAIRASGVERDDDPIPYSVSHGLDGSTDLVTADGKHTAKWWRTGPIHFSKQAPPVFCELAQRVRERNG